MISTGSVVRQGSATPIEAMALVLLFISVYLEPHSALKALHRCYLALQLIKSTRGICNNCSHVTG